MAGPGPSSQSPAAPPAHELEQDSARASFLRMVSHELRTPLNSIIGFSELLSCELFGPLGAPQYLEYAGIINDSGKRLLNLVNQVIEVVRLEQGAAELQLRPQALDHVLHDVLEPLAADLAGRGVRVEVEDAGRLPRVMADERGLTSVLSNLLQNAVSFSPEGASVTVRTRRRGPWVLVEIEDAAGGVPLEDIPRLLRPFEQGENALTRSTDGAGLGLTIVRLQCEAMGGALKLDSRPGQGLTAVVALPAAPAVEIAAEAGGA